MSQKKDVCIYKFIRYGKWLLIFFFAFSCSTIIFQILRNLYQKNYMLLYSYEVLLLICSIACILFIAFYFLEKYYAHKVNTQKITQLLSGIHLDTKENLLHSLAMTESENKSRVQDEKNIHIVENKDDWKVIGLQTCIRVAKENLQVFCDYIRGNEKDCDEGIELVLFEKIMDRLLQDMNPLSFTLSGIDIRLMLNQLESTLLAYKQHRYDKYIGQLNLEEQLRVQLLLCDESFELICETMKERFHYLPSQLELNLKKTISCLEKEIEKENAYAQYDFANICFSSNNYHAMDLAIELLYRAQEKHSGAKEYIQRLRNA